MNTLSIKNFKSFYNKNLRKFSSTSLPNKFTDLLKADANHYFLDRTLFISKAFENNNIDLILRPGGFGKTFNLNMLKHFAQNTNLSRNKENLRRFFEGSDISKNTNFFEQHFLKHPVIAFNFEELDQTTYKDNIEKFKYLLNSQIQNLFYTENISNLSDTDKKTIEEFLLNNKDLSALEIIFKTRELCRLHGIISGMNPLILIDSYDAALLNSNKKEFYSEMLWFVENLFKNLLKNNCYLKKAIITGVHKLESEKLFYPLRNLDIYSGDDKFSSFFGVNENDLTGMYETRDLNTVKEYSGTERETINKFMFTKNYGLNEKYTSYLAKELNLPKLFERALGVENNIELIKTIATLENKALSKLNNTDTKWNSQEVTLQDEISLNEISKESILTYLYNNALINKDGSVTNKLASHIITNSIPDIQSSLYDINKKLAFGYYKHFSSNHIEEYLDYFQKTFLNSQDVPQFRADTDLEKFVLDKLTFEMDNPNSTENVEIYEVDDNEFMKVSNELKRFTLITYEKQKIALFVRAIRYKTTTSAAKAKGKEEDLTKVTELYNNPNIDENKVPKRPLIKKLTKKTIENQLRKLNETNLGSIDKNEAIEYLIKLSGDYERVYFISISNYQKYIDYAIEASNIE
jgi:hypothetical protein